MFLLLLGLGACGPAEGRFVRRLYELSCESAFTCYPEEVALYYLDVDACVEAHASESEELLLSYRACEYQKLFAVECLDAFGALGCEGSTESLEVCDEVWDCQER